MSCYRPQGEPEATATCPVCRQAVGADAEGFVYEHTRTLLFMATPTVRRGPRVRYGTPGGTSAVRCPGTGQRGVLVAAK